MMSVTAFNQESARLFIRVFGQLRADAHHVGYSRRLMAWSMAASLTSRIFTLNAALQAHSRITHAMVPPPIHRSGDCISRTGYLLGRYRSSMQNLVKNAMHSARCAAGITKHVANSFALSL